MPEPSSIPARMRLLDLPTPGWHVLVVGGGPLAASRVHSLAGSPLMVIVVAPALCDDLFDLLVERRFRWFNRPLSVQDLAGAWLVHLATDDPDARRLVDQWVKDRRSAGMPA